MFPTPTPGFIPPAIPPVAVGVGGAGVAAAAAVAAVAAAAPVAAVAVGAAAVGVGIFVGAQFLAQQWGYMNGRDKPDKGNTLPNGVGVNWSGPAGKAGFVYDITFKWPIRPSQNENPDGDTPELELGANLTNVAGPFDGAYANTDATNSERGKWYYGVTRDGEPYAGSYWDQNRVFYSAGEGGLSVEVRQVGSPDPSPLPPPYVPRPPAVEPEPLPEPEAEPEPRKVPPIPLPQAPPNVEPLPPIAPPAPNPAPAPAPQPTPTPSPSPPPTVPGSESIGNNGSRPAPKPAPIVTTDKNSHFVRGGRIGGQGFGPTNPQQVSKELGRIEQKMAYMLQNFKPNGPNYGEILLQILQLLSQVLPGADYTLTEKCEPCGDDSTPCPAPVYEENIGAGTFGTQGLAYRMDALARLIDASLGAKQLTCAPSPRIYEGDWVTIRFDSDAPSPMGKDRLRKLFRYRTLSSRSIGQLSEYWADFTWNAGSVCVKHISAPWGTPQCWAESADEGKRVIRFAAAESGFDPDAVGKWEIGFSRNPRYGQSGFMRVARVESYPAVTSRDGPSGLPLVAIPGAD